MVLLGKGGSTGHKQLVVIKFVEQFVIKFVVEFIE